MCLKYHINIIYICVNVPRKHGFLCLFHLCTVYLHNMVGAMSIDIEINRRSLNPDFQILSSYLKIIFSMRPTFLSIWPQLSSIIHIYIYTRSLGPLRGPTSSWRPLGPAWLRPSRPSGAQAVWPTQMCP